MNIPFFPPLISYIIAILSSLFRFEQTVTFTDNNNNNNYNNDISFSSSSYPINVAFVGNSIQYFNDGPRFMEALSNNFISQDSCLRPSACIKSLYKNGNGMSSIWSTANALLSSDGTSSYYYDLGAPNVTTLLYERDWDYVVMNDRTYYPALQRYRKRSLKVLKNVYVPILQDIGARMVFIATHAYRNDSDITASIGNVTTYTTRIRAGYESYATLLSSYLPSDQSPLVAPVGEAFLTVYNENATLWYLLYNTDGFHPSPHGTFLQGCVLYCVLFGRPPEEDVALGEDGGVLLWEAARAMQPEGLSSGGDYLPRPSEGEREYLYDVAVRVTLGDG